jgi:hypothetical protein
VEFSKYLTIIIEIIVIIAAWRFSDWRNWKKYYSTILFTIALDLTVTLLTYNTPLWHFEKAFFLPNHVLTDLFTVYLYYPPLILIYLSHYPFKKRLINQTVYIVKWTLFWAAVERLYVFLKLNTHDNGWNMWWTTLIWFFMFIGIRLHYTRPLLTWVLCFLLTVFFVIYFSIQIGELN